MNLYCIIHDTEGGYSQKPFIFCGTINNVQKFEPTNSKGKPKIWLNVESAKKRLLSLRENLNTNIGFLPAHELYLKDLAVSSGMLHF